jgi:hypothetical protein
MTLMFHSAYSECSALAQAGGLSLSHRKNLAKAAALACEGRLDQVTEGSPPVRRRVLLCERYQFVPLMLRVTWSGRLGMKKIVSTVVIGLAILLSACSKEPAPAGPKGEAGAQGAAGPQGPQGVQGVPGAQGQAGAQGPQGSQGAPGDTGPKGDKGDIGTVGPAGPAGPKGDNGEVGAIGPAGPPGAIGPAGPAGPPGAAGPASNRIRSVKGDGPVACESNETLVSVFCPAGGGASEGAKCATPPTIGLCETNQ